MTAINTVVLHIQDLFAWVLLVATVSGFLFLVWLFTDTLVTYANRRMRLWRTRPSN